LSYQLVIERRAQKALARIERRDRARIAEAIRALAQAPRPRGAKQLTGRDVYRLRVGDYRVLYEIEDARLVILVVDVGHRREVYRR